MDNGMRCRGCGEKKRWYQRGPKNSSDVEIGWHRKCHASHGVGYHSHRKLADSMAELNNVQTVATMYAEYCMKKSRCL
jgi:hypothetical protein